MKVQFQVEFDQNAIEARLPYSRKFKFWQGFFLIWRIGNFAENHQIYNLPMLFHVLLHYAEALAIAKFKNSSMHSDD